MGWPSAHQNPCLCVRKRPSCAPGATASIGTAIGTIGTDHSTRIGTVGTDDTLAARRLDRRDEGRTLTAHAGKVEPHQATCLELERETHAIRLVELLEQRLGLARAARQSRHQRAHRYL